MRLYLNPANYNAIVSSVISAFVQILKHSINYTASSHIVPQTEEDSIYCVPTILVVTHSPPFPSHPFPLQDER